MPRFNLRYENTSGQVVHLDAWPFYWNESTLANYVWEYEFTKNPISYGGTISRLTQSAVEKTITLLVWDGGNDLGGLIDGITPVFDSDVMKGTAGRLYFNDSYCTCLIIGVEASNRRDRDYIELNLTLVTSYPFWIDEQVLVLPEYDGVGDGFVYPFSYPFGYTASMGARSIINDHYAPSKALITFFGPATNPQIAIGSHIYLVNGELGESERFEIDPRNRTVFKVTQSGERVNAFAARGKTYSVFEPVPVGESIVFHNGEFAAEITLLKERSAPLWN